MTAVKLGSNIASLTAQRRLAEGTSQLSKTFERLSSGMRINRSSDDAAGLSISESLKADRRVFNQGVRNLNDGLSLLNIADGAIENLSNIVVRLKELAQQSANGVYTHIQRQALDKEAQSLSKEYTRISLSTKFNGVSLLDGSLGNGIRLQGGYGIDGSILSGLGGAIGDGTFGVQTTFQTGNSPLAVNFGDFNGDGILDIVSADASGNSFSILLGNGDGTFQTRTSYQSGSTPWDVQVGDLNGDGILDVVIADYNDSAALIHLGNGDGSFQAGVSFQTGPGPQSVYLGDLNGNGILDVLTADLFGGTVSVLLGNGDGTFQARTSYQSGSGPQSVKVGDFNGDGILDIVTADNGSNSISILLGNGDGSFQARTSFQTGANPSSVNLGDLNGNGILDLVVSDASGSTLSIFFGNGDGTFQPRTTLAAGGAPRSVILGDFNGDGILDIANANYNEARISVFLGNGDGSFQARVSYQTGGGVRTINAGDFNNNGILDLISANAFGDSVSVLLGNLHDGTGPLLPFNISTLAGARQALPVFDRKIQQLAMQRGQIGAFQSRINVAVNTLQAASENYATAESRIRDVDIAEESSRLVSLNILQQAATSVLVQANLQPELALKLLSRE